MNPVQNIENDFYSYLSGYANEDRYQSWGKERKEKEKSTRSTSTWVERIGGQHGQNLGLRRDNLVDRQIPQAEFVF